MEHKAFLSGICPNCGQALQIPQGLREFSCLYCGHRMAPTDLRQAEENQGGDPKIREILGRELPETVWALPGALEYLTSKAYPARFDAYLEQHRSVFEKIPLACGGSAEARARLAQEVVDTLKQASETGPGLTRDSRLENWKYTLCLFTLPAIRCLELPDCEALAQEIREAWCREFPKKPFRLTSHAEILGGFQPRKLCFITTAVCRQSGKPDDCPELTAFRAFRDGWLRQTPQGAALVEQYYQVAPRIVMSVELFHDPALVWPAVWQEHLRPCHEALCRQEPERCLALYQAMVRELERRFLTVPVV